MKLHCNTAEPLVPKPTICQVEKAIQKLKSYMSSCNDHVLTERENRSVTLQLSAGKHCSTTTLNCTIAHSFQNRIQRRKLYKRAQCHTK